jgi:hypothetical protein
MTGKISILPILTSQSTSKFTTKKRKHFNEIILDIQQKELISDISIDGHLENNDIVNDLIVENKSCNLQGKYENINHMF